MYELLFSFFHKILNYDVQIQRIDEYLFVIKGEDLSDLTYQENYIANLLEMYGLGAVITIKENNTILIDFGAKWQDPIERFSYKFLEPNVEHWQETSLNKYASLIEESNLWDKRRKLASNLLLLFNFNPKSLLNRISCRIEAGRDSTILTYQDSTVFQKIGSSIELRAMGKDSNTLHNLNGPIFIYFKAFKHKELELEFEPTGISLNGDFYPEEKLIQLENASRFLGSLSESSQKIRRLNILYKEGAKFVN